MTGKKVFIDLEATETNGLRLEFDKSIGAIPQQDWDRCAGIENPFVSHGFLSALEDSGCVGPSTGWLTFPLKITDLEQGQLLAVAPCYIKLHSKGEYIFDYHWADAYHRVHPPEVSYYPKLQVAVPFTPVPGRRLLVDRNLDLERQSQVKNLLLKGLKETTRKLGFSSAHITFCQQAEADSAAEMTDFLHRTGEQYHWFNDGYQDFEDYLSRLTSRKRKTIKKERRKANSHPLTIDTLNGTVITEEQLMAFFRMYELTSLQKWGHPYLNLRFFQILVEKLQENFVLFLVKNNHTDKWIAGAWNLRGSDTLFGRNWGCLEHYDLLHFEVCYYRAIDYAIQNGLKKVEAGAQGMHKIQRGYRPRPVYSAHHIESPAFRQAIADYLLTERQEMAHRLDLLTELEPFKSEA